MLARLVAMLLVAVPALAFAKGGGLSVSQVVLVVEHEGGTRKYPNQVKETFELEKGVLHYTAYFGGMPMEWNHMDSVDWKPGALGDKVFAVALRLTGEPDAGLVDLPDHADDPGAGAYVVGVRKDDAESTRVAADRKSKAWKELDAAFQAMIARFEKDTGRPLTPGKLPQESAAPPPRVEQAAPVATSADQAVRMAAPAANAALARAYATFAKKPGAVAPAHPQPWVAAGDAEVTGDAQQGFRVRWSNHPPAGFEYEAVVFVLGAKVTVRRADAAFSPD